MGGWGHGERRRRGGEAVRCTGREGKEEERTREGAVLTRFADVVESPLPSQGHLLKESARLRLTCTTGILFHSAFSAPSASSSSAVRLAPQKRGGGQGPSPPSHHGDSAPWASWPVNKSRVQLTPCSVFPSSYLRSSSFSLSSSDRDCAPPCLSSCLNSLPYSSSSSSCQSCRHCFCWRKRAWTRTRVAERLAGIARQGTGLSEAATRRKEQDEKATPGSLRPVPCGSIEAPIVYDAKLVKWGRTFSSPSPSVPRRVSRPSSSCHRHHPRRRTSCPLPGSSASSCPAHPHLLLSAQGSSARPSPSSCADCSRVSSTGGRWRKATCLSSLLARDGSSRGWTPHRHASGRCLLSDQNRPTEASSSSSEPCSLSWSSRVFLPSAFCHDYRLPFSSHRHLGEMIGHTGAMERGQAEDCGDGVSYCSERSRRREDIALLTRKEGVSIIPPASSLHRAYKKERPHSSTSSSLERTDGDSLQQSFPSRLCSFFRHRRRPLPLHALLHEETGRRRGGFQPSHDKEGGGSREKNTTAVGSGQHREDAAALRERTYCLVSCQPELRTSADTERRDVFSGSLGVPWKTHGNAHDEKSHYRRSRQFPGVDLVLGPCSDRQFSASPSAGSSCPVFPHTTLFSKHVSLSCCCTSSAAAPGLSGSPPRLSCPPRPWEFSSSPSLSRKSASLKLPSPSFLPAAVAVEEDEGDKAVLGAASTHTGDSTRRHQRDAASRTGNLRPSGDLPGQREDIAPTDQGRAVRGGGEDVSQRVQKERFRPDHERVSERCVLDMDRDQETECDSRGSLFGRARRRLEPCSEDPLLLPRPRHFLGAVRGETFRQDVADSGGTERRREGKCKDNDEERQGEDAPDQGERSGPRTRDEHQRERGSEKRGMEGGEPEAGETVSIEEEEERGEGDARVGNDRSTRPRDNEKSCPFADQVRRHSSGLEVKTNGERRPCFLQSFQRRNCKAKRSTDDALHEKTDQYLSPSYPARNVVPCLSQEPPFPSCDYRKGSGSTTSYEETFPSLLEAHRHQHRHSDPNSSSREPPRRTRELFFSSDFRSSPSPVDEKATHPRKSSALGYVSSANSAITTTTTMRAGRVPVVVRRRGDEREDEGRQEEWTDFERNEDYSSKEEEAPELRAREKRNVSTKRKTRQHTERHKSGILPCAVVRQDDPNQSADHLGEEEQEGQRAATLRRRAEKGRQEQRPGVCSGSQTERMSARRKGGDEPASTGTTVLPASHRESSKTCRSRKKLHGLGGAISKKTRRDKKKTFLSSPTLLDGHKIALSLAGSAKNSEELFPLSRFANDGYMAARKESLQNSYWSVGLPVPFSLLPEGWGKQAGENRGTCQEEEEVEKEKKDGCCRSPTNEEAGGGISSQDEAYVIGRRRGRKQLTKDQCKRRDFRELVGRHGAGAGVLMVQALYNLKKEQLLLPAYHVYDKNGNFQGMLPYAAFIQSSQQQEKKAAQPGRAKEGRGKIDESQGVVNNAGAHTAQSGAHTLHSGVRALSPGVDTLSSGARALNAGIHTLNPGVVRTLSPGVHTLNPSVHTPNPSVHTPNPSVHTPNPSVHTLNPSVHTPNPSVHTLNPSVHTPHLGVHTLNPSVHTPHLGLHTLNPSVHTRHLGVHTLNPSVHTRHLGVRPVNTGVHTVSLNVNAVTSGARTLHTECSLGSEGVGRAGGADGAGEAAVALHSGVGEDRCNIVAGGKEREKKVKYRRSSGEAFCERYYLSRPQGDTVDNKCLSGGKPARLPATDRKRRGKHSVGCSGLATPLPVMQPTELASLHEVVAKLYGAGASRNDVVTWASLPAAAPGTSPALLSREVEECLRLIVAPEEGDKRERDKGGGQPTESLLVRGEQEEMRRRRIRGHNSMHGHLCLKEGQEKGKAVKSATERTSATKAVATKSMIRGRRGSELRPCIPDISSESNKKKENNHSSFHEVSMRVSTSTGEHEGQGREGRDSEYEGQVTVKRQTDTTVIGADAAVEGLVSVEEPGRQEEGVETEETHDAEKQVEGDCTTLRQKAHVKRSQIKTLRGVFAALCYMAKALLED